MGFIILLVICCALVILIMLGFIVYTIATGQFHALPKEIIITAIPSLILFLMFKFCKAKIKSLKKMFKKKQMKKHRQRQMKVKKLQTFCIIVCQHIICLIYHWLTVTITLKFVLLKVKSLILQN